ncbi:helix-turn-helix domain-containing protein [bacterium D16-51]|nr:helix-turn-helix domain-containing protein [bacterium D16-59]RKI55823.1 helix-turn-helix domain-containing protein [bacterium D16-51]
MEPMYLNYFTRDDSFPFFIQYGYHDENVFMHYHADFSELVIIMNGTALHHVNQDSWFIKKGDVFVLGHDVVHGYTETNELQLCNIMFPEKILLDSDFDTRKLSGFHALFVIEPYLAKNHEFQSHLTLNLQQFEQVRSLTDTMLEEYQAGRTGRTTLVSSYFMVLVTLLSRFYHLPEKENMKNIMNIAKSVSYMENHFTEAIPVNRLAEISNLSTRHFTRLFTATYHITPGSYLLSLRMQYACHLLENSSDSVSEIALQCGFNDSNYFSRQFHKLYKFSPREYRKMKKII